MCSCNDSTDLLIGTWKGRINSKYYKGFDIPAEALALNAKGIPGYKSNLQSCFKFGGDGEGYEEVRFSTIYENDQDHVVKHDWSYAEHFPIHWRVVKISSKNYLVVKHLSREIIDVNGENPDKTRSDAEGSLDFLSGKVDTMDFQIVNDIELQLRYFPSKDTSTYSKYIRAK